MSIPALIFGAGGHAHVIASFLDTDVCFLVDGPATAPNHIRQSEFFERIDDFRKNSVYIGIGQNAARMRIFDQLVSLDVLPSAIVAPGAFIARDATIGPGAVICAGAVIGSRAEIGLNTIVNTLSSVDHDCKLGDHSQITAGVTIGGTVSIGRNCFFGIRSSVIPNRTIGDDVIVMAGAQIVRDVPDRVMMGGAPARLIRNL